MEHVVILILAVVWAVFLVPELVRLRAERVSSDSIGAFRRQLRLLERAGPAVPSGRMGLAPGAVPESGRDARQRVLMLTRTEARKRRRDILAGLVAAMAVTLPLALLTGSVVLVVLHLVADVAFGAYLTVLICIRGTAAERSHKVHFLPAPPGPEAEVLLRRSAN